MWILGGTLAVALLVLVLLRVDWTPGRYKVIFHLGDKIGIGTRASNGSLAIEDGQIRIRGEQNLSINLAEIQSAELFRLHGLGRMIRIRYAAATIFVAVVRFSVAGRLAMIDAFKTGKLARKLQSMIGLVEAAG